MATATLYHDADRKRAFVADDPLSFALQPSPKKIEFSLPSIQIVTPSPRRPTIYTTGDYRRRRKDSVDRTHRGPYRVSMQVPPSPRTFAAPMPSFMTVFDEDSTRSDYEELSSQHASEIQKSLPSSNSPTTDQTDFGHHMNDHFSPFHKQRDSISTSASESADSSPTTTVSTLDSSSMTEPSPGPSPETPASSMPLTYTMDESRFQPPTRSNTEPASHFFDMQQRPSTPAKKPRNLKNLAVNTASAYNLGRAIMSAPFAVSNPKPTERTSAPSSPVFVKPPTPPRRKLANVGLTIMTPAAAANVTIPRLGVPSTPSITKPNTLRHFQSSPSLPLMTPSHAPVGGMTLPSLRTRPGPRGFADIPLEDEEEEADQNFDVPQSQEEKPESYPNGPIRIYEDGVDLYYEPNVEVASRYDVIFNVASEVKNPFNVAAEAARSPQIAEPTVNIGVLAEGSEATASSPSTPKATPITTQMPPPALPTKQPEYIHIPWEHNTDLVPDLHRLVKVIDERVQQGKRVLVHCQCGVSRSATLIVAYGIYKNPGISVQEAYDAVKKRSKWIGPNMNLIMQLQEFRTGLIRNSRRELFTMPRKLSTTLSSASTMGSFDAGSNPASGPITPRTAPLPPERSETSPNRARTSSMGPLSATPSQQAESPYWAPDFRRSWGEGQSTNDINMNRVSIVSDSSPYVDAKGHVVPMITVIQQEHSGREGEIKATHSQFTPEVRATTKSQKRKTPNFSRTLPLRKDAEGDSPMTDAHLPPLPNLMSPRSDEFHMIGLPKEPVRNDDSFGLFSPLMDSFPTEATPPKAPSTFPFPSLVDEKPKPAPAALNGFSFFPQQSSKPEPTFSIMSPTKSEFPRDFPLRNDATLKSFDTSRLTPRKNVPRSIKTKFSSPNLQESVRLHRLQDEIESSLPGSISPKRHMDDLDALMSPRATTFTVNPFHDLLAVKQPESSVAELLKPPVTPTSSDVDPRSPAQLGISPITRNIFDVL